MMSYILSITTFRASLVAQTVKNLPAIQETWVQSLSREDFLEEGMATPPVSLPGEFHGQKGLVGYSSWGHTELDMTENAGMHRFQERFLKRKLKKKNKHLFILY